MSVLVVGGGITGLSAAHALGRAGIPTVLLEATDRLGGKAEPRRWTAFSSKRGRTRS